MSNLYKEILFNFLDKGEIVKKDNYSGLYESVLVDTEIYTSSIEERESYIWNILTENEKRDVMHLVTELERIFFNLGFKACIKHINEIEKRH